MAAVYDTLAPYTRDSGYGPTRTKTATKRFEQRLRGVLARINSAIRTAIIQRDIFNLQGTTDTLDVEEFPEKQHATTIAAFVRWLRGQLRDEYLTVVTDGENQYIRRAYNEGVRLATSQLQEADVPLESVDIQEIVDARRYDRGLQTLFSRAYEELESVSEDVASEVRDELVEGFRDGEGPREIARNITDRVDSIGKYRSTLIARSECINAHTSSHLERAKEVRDELDVPLGVSHVGRVTAKDPSVCSFCRKTSDNVYSIEEFESTTVQFRGSIYRLAPPSHPQGRCSVAIEVGVTEDDLRPLSERVPGSLVT